MGKYTESEDRPQIKLNRKMRKWNKYKKYVYILGAVLVALIIIINVVPSSKSKSNGDSKNAKNEVNVSQETQTSEQTTAAQSTSEKAAKQQSTTAAQEQTTVAVKSGTTSVKINGSADREEFTEKDFYNNSVFIGDSLAQGVSYYEYLDDSQVKGDTNMISNKLADYVDSVSGSDDKVFIMLGLNDANYDMKTADSIAENIADGASQIKKNIGKGNVYVVSVLPVTSAFENKSDVTQGKINDINQKLSELAAENGYTYVDAADAYKDGTGYLMAECTGNGCNIYGGYYPFLLNQIAKAVQ